MSKQGKWLSALLAGVALGFALPADAAGDAKRGAADFRVCMTCHSVEPGQHMTGPSLAGVWGRKAGSVQGFMRYSDALKNSSVTWNQQTLDKWLQDPGQFIPHNDMAFPGIKERRTRNDIIAYLAAASKGKAPSVPSGQGGMMGGGSMSDLKQADAESEVKSIRHCRDTYFVTTADGKTHKVWEFNLRFKTDSSAKGPHPGRPMVAGVGMRGDRVAVVFSAPAEFGSLIRERCE
jgi:cytochrome c